MLKGTHMTTARDGGRYDVIVVGGGPAGSTAAALLAGRGRRVLLLERDTFPRYHIGESLITGMMGIIGELGLTERLESAGFQRKYGISLVWGDEPRLWGVSFAEAGGPEYSYHVSRAAFDALLLTRARELGAEVVQDATVRDAITEGGRVTGVRYSRAGHGRGQELLQARAAMVIDASGQARVLARKLTPVTWQEDLRNMAIWGYFSPYRPLPGPSASHILVEATEGGWFWGIPLAGNTISVGYVTPVASLAASPLSPAELYDTRRHGTLVLKDLLAGAERQGELRTTRDWSHTSARFCGPGWLLAGDSAAFIDPLFSSGVWLGMSGAWLAARAADRALDDPGAETAAFGQFERTYRPLAADILEYVRYFYDPRRRREDYFQRAQAAVNVVTGQSRVAFVALVSGIAAVPELTGHPAPVPAGS